MGKRAVEKGKVFIIGAGPGDPELITLRGWRILQQADLILYAASLVSESLMEEVKPDANVRISSDMHLEEMVEVMIQTAREGKVVARVHSGDPSVYGAILEQMVILRKADVPFEVVPGVSSVFAAAATLGAELTVPQLSQTVILTRTDGRATPLPEGAKLRDLAKHPATLAIFLSAALTGRVVEELRAAGLPEDTPIVVVEKASWPDEQILHTNLAGLQQTMREARIHRQALIMVGRVFAPELLENGADPSRLYDKTYTHLFRQGVADS